MSTSQSIIVVGDIHAHWEDLNALLVETKPSLVLQVGDFGFWPSLPAESIRNALGISRRRKYWDQDLIYNAGVPIYWCAGNHEDWWSLQQLKSTEVLPDIHFMPTGSVLELPDGRKVLFVGGAESRDRNSRILGLDWFPDEVLTTREFYNLPECQIDIVISHTCPTEFMDTLELGHRSTDPCNLFLSQVLEKYHPSLWYFGHFHRFREGFTNDCRWTCLSTSKDFGWWQNLLC